jgi:hypothetical protein
LAIFRLLVEVKSEVIDIGCLLDWIEEAIIQRIDLFPKLLHVFLVYFRILQLVALEITEDALDHSG